MQAKVREILRAINDDAIIKVMAKYADNGEVNIDTESIDDFEEYCDNNTDNYIFEDGADALFKVLTAPIDKIYLGRGGVIVFQVSISQIDDYYFHHLKEAYEAYQAR